VTTLAAVSVDPQSAQLQRIWIDCIRSVLDQVAGFPVTVEPSGDEEPVPEKSAPDQRRAGMVITVSKALRGDMAIFTSEAGALALAQLLIAEPSGPAVPFDSVRRDAYEGLLGRVLGQVATNLKQAAGGEVEVKPSGNEVPSWTDASHLGIRITGEKLGPIQLTLVVSPELAKSLLPQPQAKAPPAPATQAPPAAPAAPAPQAPPAAPAAPAMQAPPAAPATPAPQASPAPPSAQNAEPEPLAEPEPSGARGSNLELLLDVMLDVTIRFGQKNMLLREILELHPGIAIALDRQIQEPVELLVGGRAVAQGEVVIVDGNYGLRITEILSPQQRIESLGKQR
jgi:flagellar motor switch protein FliN